MCGHQADVRNGGLHARSREARPGQVVSDALHIFLSAGFQHLSASSIANLLAMPAAEEAETSSAAASPSREDVQLKRKRSSSASLQEQGTPSGHTTVIVDPEGTGDLGANGNQDPPAPRGSPPPMPDFQYVPRVPARLKPGEELLDEATQAKLLARRTRDSERKWLASQRAKFAAAHGFDFSPRTYKPPTTADTTNTVEEVHVEEEDRPAAPATTAPSKSKMGKKATAIEKMNPELATLQPAAAAPSVPSPAEEQEDQGHEDSDDDGSSEGGKLYCICRTLYGESGAEADMSQIHA